MLNKLFPKNRHQHKVERVEKKSVQEWIPILDINQNIIQRRDGGFVTVLEVEPINIDLFNSAEKERIISSLHEAINGFQEAIQILSIGKPVDLDGYLVSLNQKMQETDNQIRKKLLREYAKNTASIAAGGETLERKFYILLSQKKDKNAKEFLLSRSQELAGNLQMAGLKISICNEQELINLAFVFSNPAQAAFERPPVFSASSIPTQINFRLRKEVV